MTRSSSETRNKFSRRNLLKGAAAGGAVAATQGIAGFPTVWAQNTKDVTLVHAGGSYAAIKEIGDQASKDLGFKITMQAITDDVQLNRSLTQPTSIDINNIDSTKLPYLAGKGVLTSIPVSKYKLWGETVPLFTKGSYPSGDMASTQGLSPIEAMFYEAADGKKLASKPTEFRTMIPTIYNADTLGIRPDLVGGRDKVVSWKDLLDPKYKGKTALVDYAPVGVMDVAMALESRGDFKYADKGNMTKAEIDKTIQIMIGMKKAGHFRALWNTFDQSVNLMASGEVVIQSMWSPAVTAVKTQGIKCVYQPLKEGYGGWGNGLALLGHLDGLKRDAAYEYLNWYNTGWVGGFIAKQGYYSADVETAKAALTPNERGFFYEGKPATADITSPTGEKTNSAGEVRDGGSYEERFSKVAVWNCLMDEAEYQYSKWNEFSAA